MSDEQKQLDAATEFQAPTITGEVKLQEPMLAGGMQLADPISKTTQISHAVTQMATSGADPASIERMVKLYRELLAMDAKQEYIRAMATFQAHCPEIKKEKKVSKRGGVGVLYRYAPLDAIDRQTREVRERCGLSHKFDFEQTEKGTQVSCTVTHIGGHSESTTVFIPATKGMNTSSAQDQGIVMQYGMRYSMIAAFGITTADDDTDANQIGTGSQGSKPLSDAQKNTIADLLSASGRDKSKFLSWLGVGAIDEIQAHQYARAEAALKKAIEAQP